MAFDPALLALLSKTKLGALATIKRDGRPQLSNINFHFDPDLMWARISVTADRVKVKNLRRDPRASLLVSSRDGWEWTVAEGDAELSAVATRTDDQACDELVEVYREVAGREHPDWDEYRRAMVADRRMVIRLRITHVYGDTK